MIYPDKIVSDLKKTTTTPQKVIMQPLLKTIKNINLSLNTNPLQ